MKYLTPIIVYLSPLLLGLIIPFLVLYSHHSHNSAKKLIQILLVRITLPVIIITIIIGVLNNIIPHTIFSLTTINFIYLAVFLWGWALMTAGFCYLFITLGLDKNLIYVIISILMILANTTVFYINPFINAVQSDIVLRQWLIKVAVHINPMLTIASNFFKHDILRSNSMYSICDIGPYYFYGYANWIKVLLYYVLIGFLALGLSVIINSRILRRITFNNKNHNEKN
ncbi:MAG: hypothetical protein V1709_06290 [Planctomycetota bacterium]